MAFNVLNPSIAVVKFGGTSVVKPADVLKTLDTYQDRGRIAVVSALAGVTDKLLAIADNVETREQLWREIVQQHLDLVREYIGDDAVDSVCAAVEQFLQEKKGEVIAKNNEQHGVSREKAIDNWLYLGELFSAFVLEKVLNHLSRSEIYHAITKPLTKTDMHGGATHEEMYLGLRENFREQVRRLVTSNLVAIVPGHPGPFPDGGILEHTDRGYSDWMAVQAAIACNDWGQVQLIIAKEIDSLFSADPKKCAAAKARAEITITELAELAEGAGIKAINPSAAALLVFALKHGCQIDLWIKNTLNTSAQGTQLVTELRKPETQNGIRFVSGKRNQILITVRNSAMSAQKGWLEKIAQAAASANISIGPINGANTSVTFTIDEGSSRFDEFVLQLREIAGLEGSVNVQRDLAVIYCVGHQLQNDAKVYSAIGAALLSAEIYARPLSNDDFNAIYAVPNSAYDRAVNIVNKLVVE